MRKTGMFVLAGLLLAPTVQAALACQEPVAVARAFFEATTGDGDLLEPPPALVSPAFGKALRGERACQQREEGICTIDSDPWLDAQDGDIETPVRYRWKRGVGHRGRGRIALCGMEEGLPDPPADGAPGPGLLAGR